MPHIHTAPMHSYTSQECTHPHMSLYSSVHLYVFGGLYVVGVVMGSPLCWDTSLTPSCLGVPPLQLHPHTQLLVPCASLCFRDISMLCGHFPSVEGFGDVPHQLGGVLGHQHLRCPYGHSCTFFVVHCLMFQLWLWLLLLRLQWYLLACHQCHQWQWLLPWQGFQ